MTNINYMKKLQQLREFTTL